MLCTVKSARAVLIVTLPVLYTQSPYLCCTHAYALRKGTPGCTHACALHTGDPGCALHTGSSACALHIGIPAYALLCT